MKAMATKAYGPIESLEPLELPEPVCGPGQVRVVVKATSINPADAKVLTGALKFLHCRKFPLVLGYDFAGVIDTAGAGVSGLKVGDEVFGFLAYSGKNNQGAFSEKIVVSPDTIARKPEKLTFVQAACAATASLTALHGLRWLRAQPAGLAVLVNGATGGVGSQAVQIAKILGAQVTAVCSEASMEYARSLGAEKCLDYRKVSLPEIAERYSLLFDAFSNLSFFKVRHLIQPGGRFVTLLPSPSAIGGLLLRPVLPQKCAMVMVKSRTSDLEEISAWLNEGRLKVPVAETYPLAKVSEAITRLGRGGVQGKIAVSF